MVRGGKSGGKPVTCRSEEGEGGRDISKKRGEKISGARNLSSRLIGAPTAKSTVLKKIQDLNVETIVKGRI